MGRKENMDSVYKEAAKVLASTKVHKIDQM